MQIFKRAFLIVALLTSQGTLCSLAEEDSTIGPFKIFKDGDVLLIPMEVEGKNCQFVLDTGCAMTVIDRSLLRGQPSGSVRVETSNDTIGVPTFAVPKTMLGKLSLDKSIQCIAGSDLADLRKVGGHEFYGILGIDFLAKWVVEIDFDRGELYLRKTFVADSKNQPIELSFSSDGLPIVRAELEGWGAVDFFIDSGNWVPNSGDFESRNSNYLLQLGAAKLVGATKTQSFSGSSKERLIQARNLGLGDFKIPNPIFGEGKQTTIGLYFLSRFRVVLDFPEKKMYLVPNKSFSKCDKRNLSGMALWKLEEKVTVESVESGSVAEKAGVQVGDIIVKIDDQPSVKLRMHEIGLRFCEPDTNVRLTLSRSGKEVETTLSLQ